MIEAKVGWEIKMTNKVWFEVREISGKAIIALKTGNGRDFGFGYAKAKAICEAMPILQKFVENSEKTYEKAHPSTVTPTGNQMSMEALLEIIVNPTSTTKEVNRARKLAFNLKNHQIEKVKPESKNVELNSIEKAGTFSVAEVLSDSTKEIAKNMLAG